MPRDRLWRAARWLAAVGLLLFVDGDMPPGRYTMIHRGATLTDAEADRLVAALAAMDDGR